MRLCNTVCALSVLNTPNKAIQMSMNANNQDEIDDDALQQILDGLPGVDSSEVKKNMEKDSEK